MKRVKFVGLDVHAETIAIAIADQDGEVRWLGVIPNREDSVRKLVRKSPCSKPHKMNFRIR
jgi:transposase